MSAIERVQAIADRQKINKLLDHWRVTNKQERNEVIDRCAEDVDARKYYVRRYEEELS